MSGYGRSTFVFSVIWDSWRSIVVPNDRENILSALREKPLKVYEVMKRANVARFADGDLSVSNFF